MSYKYQSLFHIGNMVGIYSDYDEGMYTVELTFSLPDGGYLEGYGSSESEDVACDEAWNNLYCWVKDELMRECGLDPFDEEESRTV